MLASFYERSFKKKKPINKTDAFGVSVTIFSVVGRLGVHLATTLITEMEPILWKPLRRILWVS